MSNARYITFDQQASLGKRAPFWVINASVDAGYSAKRGIVIIPIARQNGDPLIVRVPATWIPVDISQQVPTNVLLESTEIRQAVASEVIGIISAESAQAILAVDGADSEARKVRMEARNVREAASAKTITQSNVTVIDSNGKEATGQDQRPPQRREIDFSMVDMKGGVQNDSDGLPPSFKMWVEPLKERSDVDVQNAVRSRQKFDELEVKYMMNAFEDKPKTSKMLKAALAQMTQ